jgi:hypothetical protein
MPGVLPVGWQFTNRLQTERPVCGECLLAIGAFADSTVAEVFAPSHGAEALRDMFELRAVKP